MKSRGFTLIELIAVMIIIGLLAVITTPIIMNSIEKSKKESALRNAEHIIKAATLDYTQNDNFTVKKKDILALDYDGQKPDSGYIQFNENEKVRFYMVQDGYCVAKRYDSELTAIKLKDNDICDWYTGSNIIREESSQNLLTLNEISEGNLLNYRIYGNSYQETRSGKNLLNINRTDASVNWSFDNTNARVFEFDKIYVGLTANNYYQGSNPSYRKEGNSLFVTTAQTGYGIAFPLKVKGNTTYTISGSGDKNKIGIGQYDADGKIIIDWNLVEITTSEKTFTTNENTEIITVIFRPDAESGEVEYKNIQLEEGSTVTLYEEYGVKPSPEYPSEIESLGTLVTDSSNDNYGKYKIDIKNNGNNLFDIGTKDNYFNGINYFTFYKDKIVGINATYSSAYITNYKYFDYIREKSYTFSFTADASTRIYVSFYDKNKNNISEDISISGLAYNSYYGNGALFKVGNTLTINMDREDVEYVRFGFATYDESLTLEESKITVSNLQLELGTSATEYETYKEETVSIYLNEPLRCVGEVCDYIDFDNGQVVRNIKSIYMKDLKWTYNSNNGCFYTNQILDSIDKSNYLGFMNTNYNVRASLNDNSSYINHQRLYVYDKRHTNLESFKSGLGDGKINYHLNESQYENINLPQIKIFDGINNIIVTDGNLYTSKIEVVALKK